MDNKIRKTRNKEFMKLPIKKTFVAFLFVTMFVGEVSFQISNNAEVTKRGLYAERDNEMKAVLLLDDVLAEKALAEKRAESFQQAKAQYVQLNERALRREESTFMPYDQKILDADTRIVECWKPYNDLVAAYQKTIDEKYSALLVASDGWLGKLVGVQYGVTASSMAIALAFFSVFFLDWRRHLLFGSAFVAQVVASNLIRHGAMLKYGDPVMAWGFFGMFLLCAPMAYHFGIIIYHMEMPVQGVLASNLNFSVTKKVNGDVISSFSASLDGYKQAVAWLSQQYALGEHKRKKEIGVRRLARQLQVDPRDLLKSKDCALNAQPVFIPKRYRSETNGVVYNAK